MTTYEFAEFVLQTKKEGISGQTDEEAATEIAQLVSGSFTYALHGVLWVNGFDMDLLTGHLKDLYDSNNHFGLIYFMFILANATDFIIPAQFTGMSAKDTLVPILSAAIIEDWMECDDIEE